MKWQDWYMMASRDDEARIWPPNVSMADDMSESEREPVV